MPSARPTIAIDYRAYDHMTFGGQYRYSVDLITGLAELRPEMDFLVLGTRPEPLPEITHVFRDPSWRYVSAPKLTGKGSHYREHALYFRLLRKLKIDLLHTLHTFVPIYPPVPVVETVHDMMFEIFPEYAHVLRMRDYRLHKWAFRKFVTRAIAISQTTAKDLERLWHFPASHTDVVHHGIAPAAESEAAAVAADELIVLSPYNLESRKNLTSLLEAVAQSQLRFKLILFGRAAVTDELERAFHQNVERLGIANQLILTGRLTDAELNGWYRRADVFAFPSLYEGFGLPVVEAMQAETCVIVHDASAMTEIVGSCGLKVNMRNTTEITQALERCLQTPSLRCEMGKKAAERAKIFTRERMATGTLAVYEKALNQPKMSMRNGRAIKEESTKISFRPNQAP